uniref:Odorant binding protein 15 n=1 Tax=Xylotrechus quadripes TaxID=554073 RepID=A0A346HGN7_9CUCU|nr:odorant binding protein 15 [Xylotrechus quadripes]
MKPVLVFLCAIVVGITGQNRRIVEEQNLHHIHDACQADPATNADHELLHNLAANIDNPQVGAHMLCESKGVGLQKPNGELDPETIRSKLTVFIDDPAKVDKLIKECAIQKNTPEKTAIYLFMCMDKEGVTYFHEF